MWTVPMCCVWAATRDIEAVAHVELSDPDSKVWLFADDSLPFWQGAHALAWRSYLLEEAGGTSLPDLGVALLQLQEHAARGAVVLRGLLRDEGKAEAIPADAWANLKIMTWRSLPGFIAGPPDLQPSAYWWSRLRVLPDELIGVWPRVLQAEELESRAALASIGPSDDQHVETATPAARDERQSKFDAEKRRRTGRKEVHSYDAMTMWARRELKVDSKTAEELWEMRSAEFSRRAGRRKARR
jgi:hypothetical protein